MNRLSHRGLENDVSEDKAIQKRNVFCKFAMIWQFNTSSKDFLSIRLYIFWPSAAEMGRPLLHVSYLGVALFAIRTAITYLPAMITMQNSVAINLNQRYVLLFQDGVIATKSSRHHRDEIEIRVIDRQLISRQL